MTRTALIVAAILAAAAAGAQDATQAVDLAKADYAPSPAYEGIETAVVFGDPAAEGLYATHARVSDGARVPSHVHNIPLTTFVTSGTAYVGIGETFEEADLVAYPEGTYFVTPAGAPHFILAADGDFSILDHGQGPVETELVGE